MAHDHEHPEGRGPGTNGPQQREVRPDDETSSAPSSVVATTDPVVTSEAEQRAEWTRRPAETVVMETTDVQEPAPVFLTGVRPVNLEEQPGVRRARDAEGDDERDRPRRRSGEDVKGASGRDKDDDEDQDEDEDRRREEEHPQPQAQPSGMKNLLITAVVALICGVIGAAGYSYFAGSSKGDQSEENASSKKSQSKQGGSSKKSGESKKSESGKGSESSKGSDSGSGIPGFSSAEDAETLKRQIETIDARIDRLNQRIDQLSRPKDETPPDLHTLQIKVAELAREVDDIANLPSKYRRLENRLESLQQGLKTVRSRIRMQEEGTETEQTPGVEEPTKLPSVPDEPRLHQPTIDEFPDAAIERGIALVKEGRYSLARDIFRKLRETRPDDARVWYFSALADGLSRNDWGDQTRRFVEKGAELEREGKPPAPVVDAALAGLSRAQGKDWVDYYRHRLAKR